MGLIAVENFCTKLSDFIVVNNALFKMWFQSILVAILA